MTCRCTKLKPDRRLGSGVGCFSGAHTLDLRSMFWQLYEFQYQFDTGFTEFRVRDILVEQRYFYRFECTQHPDYQGYRDFFDGLKPGEMDSIGSDPSRPVASAHQDRKTNSGSRRIPWRVTFKRLICTARWDRCSGNGL